jgi:hypothetical protein
LPEGHRLGATVNPTLNPIPFYKSPVTIGSATAFIVALAVFVPAVGRYFSTSDPAIMLTKVEALLAIIGIGGAGIGSGISFVMRLLNKGQAITLTQASATAQITPTSQIMQDTHDAIAKGATVQSISISPPSKPPEKFL